jgi:hypothetical protein
VFVATKGTVDAKTLGMKDAFHAICFGNVSKGTIFDFTAFPVSTEGHFAQIVLVQEFAGGSLHAQIAQPVAAHDRAQPRIILGGRQDRFCFISRSKYATGFAVG